MRGTITFPALVTALLAAVLLAGLGACAKPEQLDPQTVAIRQSVTDYNDALVRAFAALDLGELESVATTEQVTEETFTMMQLQSENALMNAQLVSMEFGDVVVYAEDDVSVTTHETWDYDYVSLETSETIRSEHGVEYDLRYDLVLREGRWLVYAVDAFDVLDSDNATTP